MGPFKTYFPEVVRGWHQANPYRTLSIHDTGPLIGSAFGRAFTIPIIISGFTKTGIWPPNRHVFSDADFSPVQPTDNIADVGQSGVGPLSMPSPITDIGRVTQMISPEDIRPLPKLVRHVARRIPVVLISSPIKTKLEQYAVDAHSRPNQDRSEHNEIVFDVDSDEEQAEGDEGPRLVDFAPVHIKTRFYLVAVRGGRRNAQTFRYVAQALENYDRDDTHWLRVQGYRFVDSVKTKFHVSENDVFSQHE